jgi:hypothetical protein
MTNRMDRWWQVVGEVAPTDRVDARLQLHWAAQVLPAGGASFAALPAGHWRTEGFTGATVGRELVATRGGAR